MTIRTGRGILTAQYALVAQWIERLLAEQKVRRSSRRGGAKTMAVEMIHRHFVCMKLSYRRAAFLYLIHKGSRPTGELTHIAGVEQFLVDQAAANT